jgi:hypothetical protein
LDVEYLFIDVLACHPASEMCWHSQIPRSESQAAIIFLLSKSYDVNSGTESVRYIWEPRDIKEMNSKMIEITIC